MSLKLLNQLKSDKNIDQYVKNSRWVEYSDKIYNAIYKNINLEEFRSDYEICKGYGDAIKPHLPTIINNNFFNKIFDFYILNDLRRIYSKIKYFERKKIFLNKIDLSEDDYIINDYFKPERIFKINKNFFSEKYIRSIMFNKKCVDITNKRIFCEIGGGFGSNIHVTIERNVNIKKVIAIDIPPVLYVQTLYLKNIYPNAIIDYNDIKDKKNFTFNKDDKLEILCIPPWFINKIDDGIIDVLFNQNSFQEIDHDIVKKLLIDIMPKLNKYFKFYFSVYNEKRLDQITQNFEQLLNYLNYSFTVSKESIFDQNLIIYAKS